MDAPQVRPPTPPHTDHYEAQGVVRLPRAFSLVPRSADSGLRILITNHHLYRPGGSETWTYTMAHELARRHAVTVFTLVPGPYAEHFDVPVLQSVTDDYDLILVNHNTCLEALSHLSGFKIMTCHGTWPWQEQPVPGADSYVSISEEVQRHLAGLGFESTIIRNGIDCVRFSPEAPINERLTSVLSLCQGEEARENVSRACMRHGLRFEYLHHDRKVIDVERHMRSCDLVVGLGRSAYEAMACGRAVLVYDSRVYNTDALDGMVRPETLDTMFRTNLSGRAFALSATPERLDEEFASYSCDMGAFNRTVALREFNVRAAADAYLALFNTCGEVHAAAEP